MQKSDKQKHLSSEKAAETSTLASTLRSEENSLRVLGFTLHQARALALLNRELLHAKRSLSKLRQQTSKSFTEQ